MYMLGFCSFQLYAITCWAPAVGWGTRAPEHAVCCVTTAVGKLSASLSLMQYYDCFG